MTTIREKKREKKTGKQVISLGTRGCEEKKKKKKKKL
jgi:hypothetical protein